MNTLSIQQQASTKYQETDKATTEKSQTLITICCLTIFPLIYLIGKTIISIV